MSALLERPPAPAPASARTALRGPLWVSVRQHRTALLIAAAAVLVGALILVAYRIWAGSVTDDFAATGCKPDGPNGPDCSQVARDFSDDMNSFHYVMGYGSLFLQLLPMVLGVFVAGPVVARELESGTYKLAWTQSVSPARWLTAKLLPFAVPVLLLVPVLTAVRAWTASSLPDNTAYDPRPWYEITTYLSLGTLPLAYALFGIAAGALVGLLAARTVPAMSVTLLAFGGVYLALNGAREHLWPTAFATTPLDSPGPVGGSTEWWLEGGVIMANGDRRSGPQCVSVDPDMPACLADRGATGRYAEYHPASHFWPLQLVETGIVLVLAAACVFAAFKVLRRRHA
ncbi:hypothetical protein ACIBLA_23710 [Streptomyces sp. NPDC050433]|uniref:hypothetical protein n=1 Tax=unclassified Streptomyces TaxID=2593676 RepID=UPI0034361A78